MSDNNPKISVILPTRNGERYLKESIASCHAQTEENWELILVDDGSNDSTPSLVDAAAKVDSRISAFHIQQSFKLPGAMNFGSRQALGKYHYWLCDDDRLLPHAFARLAEVLDADSQTGLVYADHWMIDPEGARTRVIEREPYHYLTICNVVGLCRMYRSEIFKKSTGFNNKAFLTEDYDFWLRAAENYHFQHLSEPLMEVRFHSDSLTTSHYEDCQRSRVKTQAELFDTPRDIPPEWRQQAAIAIARDAWRYGLRRIAFRFALRVPFITPLGLTKATFRKLRGLPFIPPPPCHSNRP